jgi:hypothetical protein
MSTASRIGMLATLLAATSAGTHAQILPLPPLGTLTFTIERGTTDCGGPGLTTPPAPPFSGSVDRPDGTKRADLGLGCLYLGGGGAITLPPAMIPDGGTAVLAITGVSLGGLSLVLGGDPGSGPADCTLGAGPERRCLNGAPGTDGAGTCAADTDCPSGNGSSGACAPVAHCYFGPPVPVPLSFLSTCIMNGIAEDVTGNANLLTLKTALSATLSSPIYLTSDPESPCPQCVAEVCTAGERVGLPCSGGVGSGNTTVECPPRAFDYVGRLTVALSPLTTATTRLASATGAFCPGQRTPGAFGGPAGAIREAGAPLLHKLPNVFATTVASVFCIPITGNGLIDVVADLPGPGAVSVPGTAAVQLF